MKEELERKLSEKYPQFFSDSKKPPTESLMCFGCDHGDGWYHLIEAICRMVDQHVRNGGWKHEEPYRFLQIKEKYAGLRVYDHGSDEYIKGLIDMAESMSYRICEVCGDAGSMHRSGMWVKTLCGDCAEKHNYEKYRPEDEL